MRHPQNMVILQSNIVRLCLILSQFFSVVTGGALDTFNPCLRNKSIYLLGDSTLRGWFIHIFKDKFNCVHSTELWTNEKWHKPSTCVTKDLNLTVHWFPHSQPFSLGGSADVNRYTLHSISRRIDEIANDEDALIVIHIYLHIMAYHHDVFKTKMTKIKWSVENLLRRNNKAQVFIKAPHSFLEYAVDSPRFNDWPAYVFTNILFEVFKDLHDKVIFLNNMDATDALQIVQEHPPENVQAAMVEQMLSYVC